jgi:hypothetical protein
MLRPVPTVPAVSNVPLLRSVPNRSRRSRLSASRRALDAVLLECAESRRWSRGNHRAADGFLGQIARYGKIESRGNLLFLKPLRNIQEETLVAGKSEILRALEGLPQESLKEVTKFIDSLRKQNGKRHETGRNGGLLARKQISAIKKWAGRTLKAGFSGRQHDAILYRKDS